MNRALKYRLIAAGCLILSVFITYESFSVAMAHAMQGQDVVVWLHVLAFFVAVGLVSVAIIFSMKTKR